MLTWVIKASLIVSCLVYSIEAISNGTLRFVRDGIPDESQSWSSGIVQIYYAGSWGNICGDSSFNVDEAHVVCHQLGYKGASSVSDTDTTSMYGTDNATTVMEEVSCSTSTYLAITQCSFSAVSNSETSQCNNDAIVTCYTDRIWASPTTGDIRLTGGDYSNQGLLEVYCNEEWGTVCDDTFSGTEAAIACHQLGYNNYHDYDHLLQNGMLSQMIWLDSLYDCTSSAGSCLTECQNCPASDKGTECDHENDVTLECGYDDEEESVETSTEDTCDFDYGAFIVAILIGSIFFIIICCVCCVLAIAIPVCVCFFLGIGIGASSRGKKTVNQPPPAAIDNNIIGTTKQPGGAYPTQTGAYPTQTGAYPTQTDTYPTNMGTPPSYNNDQQEYTSKV